jgi:hypothetical protein
MKTIRAINRTTVLVATIVLLLAGVALASAAEGYDLSWWTVAGGGGTSGADGYTLSGTIGQPDAGVALTNDGYTLVGGFWGSAATAPEYKLYLPLVLRQYS